jgi:L-aspartate oxidase
MVYDFVIVGSGLAGLSFALKAAEYGSVLVITKSLSHEGSTWKAQGGIASVMHPEDSVEKHIQDTLVAGAGLCREERVETLVSMGPTAIQNLVDWGVQFSLDKNSKEGEARTPIYHLAKEGGHSDSRILHSEDLTGREIQRALVEAVRQHDNIEVREGCMGIDLITHKHLKEPNSEENRCYGLYALETKKHQIQRVVGRHTILSTGGIGQVYKHTTNDRVSTGDGVAMAYRAGVPLEDMEFMQFHPTSLYDPGQPTFLISEALRGHGGILINHEGKAFMEEVHPLKDLAPRDIVARAIDAEMKRTGEPCVFLDMSAIPKKELQEHFPNIYEHCLKRGWDMSEQSIPVVPAAHFSCGGIRVDEWGATELKGLYACGEVASTGVHGANRLASNSLLEAVVFSDQALRGILREKSKNPFSSPEFEKHSIKPWDSSKVHPVPETGIYSSAVEMLRSTMWNYVGIVRSNGRLKRAQELVEWVHKQTGEDYAAYTMEPKLVELRNLALVAKIVVESALWRKESRGLHYTIDYPDISATPTHSQVVRKNNV